MSLKCDASYQADILSGVFDMVLQALLRKTPVDTPTVRFKFESIYIHAYELSKHCDVAGYPYIVSI